MKYFVSHSEIVTGPLNREAMDLCFQIVHVARHLSTLSHYLKNILERPRLECQTLIMSHECLRQGVEGIFDNGAVLQRGIQA